MDDGRRVEVVQVRCSPTEKAAWTKRAVDAGVSVSELVRERMNGGLGAGEAVASPGTGSETVAARSPVSRSVPAPAPSPRPFRSDFKK